MTLSISWPGSTTLVFSLGEFIQRDMIAVRSRSSDRRSISSYAMFPENLRTSKIIPA